MMQHTSRLVLGSLSLALLAACDSSGPSSGRLAVAVAGASGTGVQASEGVVSTSGDVYPADSVAAVKLFVTRIDAKREDVDSVEAEHEEGEAAARQEGWLVVARPDSVIDLLALAAAPIKLQENTIPQGTYKGFRLVIDASKSSVVLRNGTILPGACNASESAVGPRVFFPSACSAGIKVQTGALSIDDQPATLTVELDATRLFKAVDPARVSSTGIRFRPEIRATITRK